MSMVLTHWNDIRQQMNLSDHLFNKWMKIVEEKYSEVHRHYHTLKHIEHMLSLKRHYDPHIKDKVAVFYAIIFHDIIYDPKSGDNEEQSEILFRDFAEESGLPELQTKRVSDMILATKSHSTEAHRTPGLHGNGDIHYLLDFDMAILGSCSTDYYEYADKIRKEYIHIPEEIFRSKRAEVLKEFLRTPNIFATKELRDEFEQQSRENIQSEIEQLSS